jgi:ureidoglycolate lyase
MPMVVEPLESNAFSAFGDVIDVGLGSLISINDGTTLRHDNLANIDVAEGGGRPVVSIFESKPFGFPLEIKMLERHPLSSQAFIPLDGHPYFVVVAPPGESVDPAEVRIFFAEGTQGVNFRRALWHHPAIVTQAMRFLVIDRGVDEPNCDLLDLPQDRHPLILDRLA